LVNDIGDVMDFIDLISLVDLTGEEVREGADFRVGRGGLELGEVVIMNIVLRVDWVVRLLVLTCN